MRAQGGTVTYSADGTFTARPDVAVVVFGEEPYAEFQGDLATMHYKPGDDRDLGVLRALKARGIPTVAVFLSGRPLWVNREINASNAFVAAWLPGTEGGGVADVIVGNAQGRPRADFTGTLARSWPRRPDQPTVNRGDAGADPLFAYGYGLSYARSGKVDALPEDGAVTESAAGDVLFGAGRMQGGARAILRDEAGERHVPAEGGAESPGRVIVMRPKDVGAQENARELVWSGTGVGTLEFTGLTRDLTRQANGDMAIALTWVVDQKPTGSVSLGMGCGDGCLGRVDVTPALRDVPTGQTRTVKVKLSCLAAQGTVMRRVDRPLVLQTTGSLRLVLREVRLVTNEGDAICPGPPVP